MVEMGMEERRPP